MALFALSLTIPLLILALWAFLRLSPSRPRPGPVRLFNFAAILIGVVLAVIAGRFVYGTLAGTREHVAWPTVAAFYVLTVFPLWLGVAGVIRRLVFGARGPVKPLEISRDLTNVRF
ncbi:MAG TPA: hypothetical protein PKC23_05695 [Candidatus Desulfobacillus sp.]|nr:hypothetical protein [Candidatus Desulfobacillus sp.]